MLVFRFFKFLIGRITHKHHLLIDYNFLEMPDRSPLLFSLAFRHSRIDTTP